VDNDDKTKFPSKYIKTLLPNTPVTFASLAEAMYGTTVGLSRAQNLIVQQEITRRRFVPIV
jgi:3-hydroxy-3-methylglutaryl CoA synthase